MKEREVVVTISCMSWLCNRAFYMDPATLKIKPWSTFRTLLKLMLEYGKERATILNFNQKKKKKAWVLELPCLHPLTSASTPRLHPSLCVLFPPPHLLLSLLHWFPITLLLPPVLLLPARSYLIKGGDACNVQWVMKTRRRSRAPPLCSTQHPIMHTRQEAFSVPSLAWRTWRKPWRTSKLHTNTEHDNIISKLFTSHMLGLCRDSQKAPPNFMPYIRGAAGD